MSENLTLDEDIKAILWANWSFFENYSGLGTEEIFRVTGGDSGNLDFATAIVSQIRLSGHKSWEEAATGNVVAVVPCANQLGTHVDMSGFLHQVESSGCADLCKFRMCFQRKLLMALS